ncbi:hypothetical protein GUJ93_ZPchr0005g15614 [Zizania palustris]|uniref:EF-hand domain-containing protein n=1 Tax=Zizania palustris TaxID=103762 RepID=A0A8J5T8Q8_ZIZPA|nr:hypothetical protein GUJ93_ZPchr0005g15614 [Zizania palustris]
MLQPDPKLRLTAKQVLEHPWLQNAKKAPNVPLGDIVIADHLSAEENLKCKCLLKLMANDDLRRAFLFFDKDGNGYIEPEELQQALVEDGALIAWKW